MDVSIVCTLHVHLVDGCGLTSHSAIFQIYSDVTVVQFPNLELSDTQCHGQLGVFSVPNLTRRAQ